MGKTVAEGNEARFNDYVSCAQIICRNIYGNEPRKHEICLAVDKVIGLFNLTYAQGISVRGELYRRYNMI